MLKQMFDQVREKSPLIHNITNYVTVNDCANMVLACGASPIMADDKEEVAEIQTICAGLNINIGTISRGSCRSFRRKNRSMCSPVTDIRIIFQR